MAGRPTDAAPILAAAKLSGQPRRGITIGALAATTGRVGSGRSTLEPATTYGIARMIGSSRDGQSGASLVVTPVDRSLDQSSGRISRARRSWAAATFRHRFGGGDYEVWGSATASRLAGASHGDRRRPGERRALSAATWLRDGVRFDSGTSLTGDQEELAVGKYGGTLDVRSCVRATVRWLRPERPRLPAARRRASRASCGSAPRHAGRARSTIASGGT